MERTSSSKSGLLHTNISQPYMLMPRLMLLPLILLATSFSGYADLVYDFRFGQTSYEAASGTSVNVDIFFRETATAGEDLRFFADGVGLTGLGPIGVGYGPNAPATSVLSIANLTDISVSSDFSDGQFRTRDNSSFKAEIGGQENAGISIGTNQTFHEILLGSITFEVVGNAGDTASLTLTPNDFGDIFFDNDLLPTATANFDSAGFNVIAVPEPSSCALIGVAISALALRRRRCKNQ